MAIATESVELKVRYEGKQKDLQTRLDQGIPQAVRQQTGLDIQDVTLSPQRAYSVVLHALEDGKRSEATTYRGEYAGEESAQGIELAIQNALGDSAKDWDQSNVTAELGIKADVPYFTIPVRSRALSPGAVQEFHDSYMQSLRSAYGARVAAEAERVEFRVVRSGKLYTTAGSLPPGELRGRVILAEGYSQRSFDDAASRAKARHPNDVKSAIFEQTYFVIVYGAPEPSVRVRDGVAEVVMTHNLGNPASAGVRYEPRGESPTVSSGVQTASAVAMAASGSSKPQEQRPSRHQAPPTPASREGRGYRGASPAAKDPVALESSMGLM